MKFNKVNGRTLFKVNNAYPAETLMKKLQKINELQEPIKSVSPELFTKRSDGVLPETDIRTDVWVIAQKAMGSVAKSRIAKRNEIEAEKAGESAQASSSTDTTKVS